MKKVFQALALVAVMAMITACGDDCTQQGYYNYNNPNCPAYTNPYGQGYNPYYPNQGGYYQQPIGQYPGYPQPQPYPYPQQPYPQYPTNPYQYPCSPSNPYCYPR